MEVFGDIKIFNLILSYGGLLTFIVIMVRHRKGLFYEDGNLSLGRVMNWIAFLVAVFYWLRFTLGILPPETPFPPALESIIMVLLGYNLFKHGNKSIERMLDYWTDKKYTGFCVNSRPQDEILEEGEVHQRVVEFLEEEKKPKKVVLKNRR